MAHAVLHLLLHPNNSVGYCRPGVEDLGSLVVPFLLHFFTDVPNAAASRVHFFTLDRRGGDGPRELGYFTLRTLRLHLQAGWAVERLPAASRLPMQLLAHYRMVRNAGVGATHADRHPSEAELDSQHIPDGNIPAGCIAWAAPWAPQLAGAPQWLWTAAHTTHWQCRLCSRYRASSWPDDMNFLSEHAGVFLSCRDCATPCAKCADDDAECDCSN